MTRYRVWVVGLMVSLVIGVAVDLPAHAVEASIPVSSPIAIEFSPDGSAAYAASSDAPVVSVIDTRTDSVSAAIDLPSPARKIARSRYGSAMLVLLSECDTNRYLTTLGRVDPETRSFSYTSIAVSCATTDMALSPDGRVAYVAGPAGLTAYDLLTERPIMSRAPYRYESVDSVALSHDGTRLWLRASLPGSHNNAVLIDARASDFSFGQTTGAYGYQIGKIAVAPDGTRAYAPSWEGWAEDGRRRSAIGIPENSVTDLAVSANGTEVFLVSRGAVATVSLASGRVIATFDPDPPVSGVWSSPDGGTVYAASHTAGALWRVPSVGATPAIDTVQRLAGSDRYETAILVSRAAHPHGADTVFLATGAKFPDALSAAPVAATMGGSLLLLPPGALPSAVAKEIQRLSPERIVAVGGDDVFPEELRAELLTLAPHLDRVFGADRYETSLKLAKYGWSRSTAAFIATGESFADAAGAAAAAAAVKAPLIVIPASDFEYGSHAYMAFGSTMSELRVADLRILGGTPTISAETADILAGTRPSSPDGLIRLWGVNRSETSRYANGFAMPIAEDAILATNANFPDALAGAVLAASIGAPLYTVPKDCVPATVSADLAHAGVSRITLLGDGFALSDDVGRLTGCQ